MIKSEVETNEIDDRKKQVNQQNQKLVLWKDQQIWQNFTYVD